MKKITPWLSLIAIILGFSIGSVQAKFVEYQLDVDYKQVNFTGHTVTAIAVGDSIPAPTIEATVGDTLRVTFHNKMDVETSVHWHGILLPQDQDGVPYLTAPPIAPGASFTYEYPITHHGTYWYHSHTGLQEQQGVYGALVFHPKDGERVKADREAVVVLSDWTNEHPNDVMHNLKKSDDYYALKKANDQSWFKVMEEAVTGIKQRLEGAWMRMGPMDLSDVGYDAFLANGQAEYAIPDVKAGEKVRLRLVNAAASSYFSVSYAGGAMTVVAADGLDVEPFDVKRLRLAIAETFDVIVTVPEGGAYALRATSEDNTGFSRVLLGEGPLVEAPAMPAPQMMMDHAMHSGSKMTGHDHHAMGHHGQHQMASDEMQEYDLLRAIESTQFDANNPKRTVHLKLTGDMERYAWSFDNLVLSEESQILIRRGETVQFVLQNTTMMSHPIHLHGHFFRVLNGQGDYAPLKHTVNVPAMQTVTIEFLANEDKDWFFHCHNLYHMKAGMTRVISYEGSSELDLDYLSNVFSDKHWYTFANVGLQNNVLSGMLRFENTRHAIDVEYDWDYEGGYELEALYERSFNRFFELYVGAEFEQEDDEVENKLVVGAHYVLPLLIDADIRLDDEGHGRLGFESELQLTDRLAFEWEVNTDREFHLALDYELNKRLSLIGSNDDHYGWGLGIKLELF